MEALPKPQVDGRGPRKHETGFIFTHSRFKVLCIGSMFPIDIQTLAYFIQHRSMTEGSRVHEPLYHFLCFLDRDLGGSLWDPFPVFDRYVWMISMDGERAVRRTHWRVRGPSSSMRRRSFQPGIESEKQPAFPFDRPKFDPSINPGLVKICTAWNGRSAGGRTTHLRADLSSARHARMRKDTARVGRRRDASTGCDFPWRWETSQVGAIESDDDASLSDPRPFRPAHPPRFPRSSPFLRRGCISSDWIGCDPLDRTFRGFTSVASCLSDMRRTTSRSVGVGPPWCICSWK